MNIFLSVGEPSGDLHGANLIRDLQERIANCSFSGFGGPKMKATGQQQIADLTEYAVMFLPDAVRNLKTFWNLYRQGREYLKNNQVDAVVLIDYPGFNWWIAAAAKSAGIPVFYYGVPQMWAWASWRIKKIRKYVDHVLCKLPFEKPWFEQRNCRATYVGHPFFDEISRQKLDEEFLEKQRQSRGDLITLLPGSRNKEVQTNLQAMLETASLIRGRVASVRFAIACYNERHAEYARKLADELGIQAEIHSGRTPELISSAKCCLACSGSVSLELMSHLKPTVIHFKLNQRGYLGQRILMKVRFITLVNLLATDKIERESNAVFNPDAEDAEDVPFPEYLTTGDKSVEMSRHLVRWLTDIAEYDRHVAKLSELKTRFGQPGASGRAADYITDVLCNKVLQTTDSATVKPAA